MSDDSAEIVEFIRDQLLGTLTDQETRSRIIESAAKGLDLPEWIEQRLLALAYGIVVEVVQELEDPKELPDDLLKFIRGELVELLQDEQVRSRVIQWAADALPLPNFLEKRILSILLSSLVELIKKGE